VKEVEERDIRSGRSEEPVLLLPRVSDVLEAPIRILISATYDQIH